jgi:F-type H+-transporting ATPase subunit a
MAPMNIIEELVKPVSLSLRLFGNMFGEEMVVVILFILVPFFVPVPIQLLGVLMAFIQAFVFTLLTITYISILVHGH